MSFSGGSRVRFAGWVSLVVLAAVATGLLLWGERAGAKRPRAVILSPTRELAMQISDALQPLVHVLGLRHKLVADPLAQAVEFSRFVHRKGFVDHEYHVYGNCTLSCMEETRCKRKTKCQYNQKFTIQLVSPFSLYTMRRFFASSKKKNALHNLNYVYNEIIITYSVQILT